MNDMPEPTEADRQPTGKTFIGGRHGSPTVTVALPFSTITAVDSGLQTAMADLAALVAELARHASTEDGPAVEAVRRAAEELADRLSESDT